MATTKKSPLERTREEHGGKESLVDRVLGVIHLGDTDREAMKARLLAVSNRKLQRLLAVGSEVREKYGSPERLAEAAAAALGKAKDQPYVAKLTKLAQKAPARVLAMVKRRGAGKKAE